MQPEFYKKRLKNGLTVLFEKRQLPIIASSAAIKFGSQYETENEKGIAHFIEHLMFKGTKKRSAKQISEYIEKKGGILNAYTDESVTCYWNKLPSKYFKDSLNIAADLILNPKFDAKEFEKEKHVILEEIKMHHDNPQIYSLEKIKELLYKKPFGMFGAGTAETVKSLTRSQIVRKFSDCYSPNNMVFAVVGNTDFTEICKFAEKTFPKKKKVFSFPKIQKINGHFIEVRRGIDQAHFVFGFHAPTLADKKRYAFELFDVIIGEGMSSRLFQEIREKRGLAYAVKSMPDLQKDFGYEIFYIGTVKEKIREIQEIILKEIKKINQLSQKDLSEAKEQLLGLNKLRNEDSVNTMNALIQEEIAGDAENFYKYDERILAVKLQDVRSFSKLKAYSTMALVPG